LLFLAALAVAWTIAAIAAVVEILGALEDLAGALGQP